jgi:hypothetical protein
MSIVPPVSIAAAISINRTKESSIPEKNSLILTIYELQSAVQLLETEWGIV